MATDLLDIASAPNAPPRSATAVDVSTADYEDGNGFMVRIGTAGTITYRAIDSVTDVAESYSAGDVIPAILKAVRTAGTSASGIVAFGW